MSEMTSSMSRFFIAVNGRAIPVSSTTTVLPTLTMKLPFPGLTVEFQVAPPPLMEQPWMAAVMASARFLNADHCLQASINTSSLITLEFDILTLAEAGFTLAADFFFGALTIVL